MDARKQGVGIVRECRYKASRTSPKVEVLIGGIADQRKLHSRREGSKRGGEQQQKRFPHHDCGISHEWKKRDNLYLKLQNM